MIYYRIERILSKKDKVKDLIKLDDLL